MNSDGRLKIFFIVFLLTGMMTGSRLEAVTLYVSPEGGNVSSYASWETAAHALQDAVNAAVAGDTILVTNGVYDTGGAVTPGYSLLNRVVITNAITVQSVNGPEHTMILGAADPVTGGNGVSAVRGVYLTHGAVLVGFTVSNGHTHASGDYPYEQNGGGLFLAQGGMVSNCVIVGNSASSSGGGVSCQSGGVINHSTIRGNSASFRGGGVYCESGGVINRSILYFNTASIHGGGTYCMGGEINDCMIRSNLAVSGGGGGVYCQSDSAINRSTISGNSAGEGGGVYCGYGGSLHNSILYFNTASLSGNNYYNSGSGIRYEYCCTTPALDVGWGGNNIADDPLFVDVAAGDYHLQSGSPCIGAGNNAYVVESQDLEGNARIINQTVDIGVYEFSGNDAPFVEISTPTQTVSSETTSFLISGTANGEVVGSIGVSNEANSVGFSFAAASSWSITVELVFGDNPLTVYGTNSLGTMAQHRVRIVRSRLLEDDHATSMHYVSPEGGNRWPYTNWVSAARVIQDALDTAMDGDHVLVAEGTYDTGGKITPGYSLSNRVAITKAVTLQSVHGPENTIILGAPDLMTGSNGVRAVRGVYLTNGAVLVGFTVSDGHTWASGDYTYERNGGGLFLAEGGTVSNCIIGGNSASSSGGGGYCQSGGAINHSTISSNSANNGGGLFLAQGGIVSNCVIGGNSASFGGGVSCSSGGVVNNSTITGNSANEAGGVYCYRGGEVDNSTISGNSASSGGGIFCWYGGLLQNSIFYFNTASSSGDNYYNSGAGSEIRYEYCCTTPALDVGWGGNNIADDPLFVDVAVGDYHLQSGSPCIEAGNNAYVVGSQDLEGNARIINRTVDIGAYEFGGSDAPFIEISTPAQTVSSETTSVLISGMANGEVIGSIGVSNEASSVGYSFAAAGSWSTTVELVFGDNPLTVYGTNSLGTMAQHRVRIVRSRLLEDDHATSMHYVSPVGGNRWPYTNWVSAARVIQDALDTAMDGDHVLVAEGTYDTGGKVTLGYSFSNRVAITKAVTLQSVNGPKNTIIFGAPDPITGSNGVRAVRGVYLTQGAALVGFTVSNGHTRASGGSLYEQNGGGLFLAQGGLVSNCVIGGNSASSSGGGVYCLSGGEINHSTISGNSANGSYGNGGGVSCFYGGTLNHSLISGNSAYSGGGVYCWDGGEINHSTISGNSAHGRYGSGGGVYCWDGSGFNNSIPNNSILNNSILYFNTASSSGDNYYNIGLGMSYNHCCATPALEVGLGSNNIAGDPRFVNRHAGDYHLSAGSPCMNEGNNAYVVGEFDLDGHLRIQNGTVDIGAYEYDSADEAPWVGITTPAQTVSYETTFFSISGTVNEKVVGTMWVSNATHGGVETWVASSNWISPPLRILEVGENLLYVSGTNHLGTVAQERVMILRGGIRYVSTEGTHVYPFTNWLDAATNIQEAVDVAISGDTVLVTNGIYDAGGALTPNYSLFNRVVVTNAITVQSVNGPEHTMILGAADPITGSNGVSAVRGVYLTEEAVLIGFTISNGYTRASGHYMYDENGGGLFLEQGGAISNCVIRGNSARMGGGIYCMGGEVNHSTINGNSASSHAGGVYCYDSGEINDCMISSNSAGQSGGGAYCYSGGALNNSTISGNSSFHSGGGVFCLDGGEINHSTISGNLANYSGGGVYCLSGGTLNNSTISGNSANDYGGGVFCSYGGTLNNSILYFNTATYWGGNYYNDSSGMSYNHCCATPMLDAGLGANNVMDDPLFVDHTLNDFHLQPGSPCIDAGNNAYVIGEFDLDGNLRIQNGTVDIGAYEYDLDLNVAPVIAEGESIQVTMDEDGVPVVFDLTLHASDLENDPLTWGISRSATNGTASVSDGTGTNKMIHYSPIHNYNGDDTFEVQVSDGRGGTDAITVGVMINPRNDAPNHTIAPSVNGIHHVGRILNVDPGAWNDATDREPGTLKSLYQWRRAEDTNGLNAVDIVGATNEMVALQLSENMQYVQAVLRVYDDGEGLPSSRTTTVATAWILVDNEAPVIMEGANVSVVIDEDNYPAAFDLTLQVSDVDHDEITWRISHQATNGTGSVSSGAGTNQVIHYSPLPNYNGDDQFEVHVSDGKGGTDTVMVRVIIHPRNDAPILIEGERVEMVMDEDGVPRTFDLSLHAGDVDGDQITWSISTQAMNGVVSASGVGTNKVISYSPTTNYNGSDRFEVQVSDGNGGIDSVRVSVMIDPRNDAPVNTVAPWVNGTHHVGQGLGVDKGSWEDATDLAPGSLSYFYQWRWAEDMNGLQAVDLEGATNDTYLLQRAENAHYVQAVVSAQDDGEGLPSSMTTTVATAWTWVENRVPVILEGTNIAVTMDEDGAPTDFSLSLNASDADGDPITWSISQSASNGTASVSGGTDTNKMVHYSPSPNYNGEDQFEVQVSDGSGGTNAILVNVTMNPRNDAPVNTVPPWVNGNHHIGQTLSVNPGTWNDATDLTPGTLSYLYRWRRAEDAGGLNAVDLPGATNTTYPLQMTEDGKYVQGVVSVVDDGEGVPASQTTTVATAWTFAYDVSPMVVITTTPHTVPLEVSAVTLSGTNNVYVEGILWVSNAANHVVLSFPASGAWTTPSVALDLGVNSLYVSGANQYGITASGVVAIERRDISGPRVLSHQPLRVYSAIDEVTVLFHELVDGATFGTEDVTILNAEDQSVLIHAVTNLAAGTFRIDFSRQSEHGVYRIIVGPEIYDSTGNPMNQDGDESNGEAFDDRYEGQFEIDLEGPSAIGHSLSNIQHQAARSLAITFNEPINPGYLLAPRLLRIVGPCGTNTAVAVTTTNAISALFSLPACESDGLFSISLAPEVTDSLGNFMDQDGDGTGGEPEDDVYLLQFEQVLPDLFVNEVQGPAEAQSEQEIGVEWSVVNQGGGSATKPWTDRIYISSNATPDPLELIGPLGSLTYSLPLLPDGSYARSTTVALPDLAEGAWWLVLVTDSEENLDESDGGANNLRAAVLPLWITTRPGPDLQVASLTVPDTLYAGQSAIVSWEVLNAGQAASSAYQWHDRIYLSSDTHLNTGSDIHLQPDVPNPDFLAPDETYAQTVVLDIPDTLADGSYYVLVQTDAENSVDEFRQEHNNVRASASSVEVIESEPAFLNVTSVSAPVSAQPGSQPWITWTVENTGGQTIRTGWYGGTGWDDAMGLSTNEIWGDGDGDHDDYFLGSHRFWYGCPLEPGESYTQTMQPERALPKIWASGDYYLFVIPDFHSGADVADIEQSVIDRQNGATPIILEPIRRPDLSVTEMNSPTSAWAGAEIQLDWRVQNLGEITTPGSFWKDAVFLSTNQTWGAGDIMLGTKPRTNALATHQQYQVEAATFSIPNGLEGDFYVIAQTDLDNEVYEVAETNNSLAAPLLIHLVKADLEIASATSVTQALAGTSIVVEWFVTNRGSDAATHSWLDALYLSSDASLHLGQDSLLAQFERPQELNAGEYYTQTNTVTLPSHIEGEHHLFVLCDSQNTLYEHQGETNNVYRIEPSMMISDPAPDLVLEDPSAPASAMAGHSISLSWQVSNAGELAASAPWSDAVYLSDDMTLNIGSDAHLLSVTHTNELDTGASYTVTRSVSLPDRLEGTNYLIVVTDFNGEIYEKGRTTNNEYVHPIELSDHAPDLVLTNAIAPTHAIAGHSMELQWSVVNQGEDYAVAPWQEAVYLSVDTTLDVETDLHLFSITQTNDLVAGTFVSLTNSLLLPNRLEGTYHLLILTDVAEELYEKEAGETNNLLLIEPPVQITDASPDLQVEIVQAPQSASAGGTLSVTWRIANRGVEPTTASYWVDGVYLSRDAILEPASDIQLGLISHDGILQPHQTTTQTELFLVRSDVEGEYTVYVVADRWQQVYEKNQETNNMAAAGHTTRFSGTRADLRVVQLDVPGAASAGREVTVEWTVENTGFDRTIADAWEDAIYFSDNDQLDPDDIELATAEHYGTLGAGEGYTQTRTVSLSDNREGTFYILVKTDAHSANHVFELGAENNNVSAAAIQRSAPSSADLQVTSIHIPATAWSAQELSISWTVENVGMAEAVPSSDRWYDHLYLSRDPYLDLQADLKLGHRERSSSLAAGSHYTAQHTARLPVGQTGPFYLLVWADSTDHVDERDAENNNLGISSSTLQINLPPPADLQVIEALAPTNPVVYGEAATWGFQVVNVGESDAVGIWWDTLYLSTDSDWDADDPRIARIRQTNGLAVGAQYDIQLTTNTPPVLPGDYQLLVRADIFDDVRETDDLNNIGSSTGSVQVVGGGELFVDQVETHLLTAEQSIYYQLQVSAGDDVLIALSNQHPEQVELYIGYERLPTRSDFDGRGERQPDGSIVALIPGKLAGNYYLLLYGRSPIQPALGYTLLASRPGLSATQLSVTEAGNMGSTTLTIDGYDFETNTVVHLEDANGNRIAQGIARLNAAGQIVVTFDLTHVDPGEYTLVLENPGGSSASTPFSVVDGQGPDVFARMVMPTFVRVRRPYTFTLEYGNRGDTDAAAPLIQIRQESVDARLRLTADEPFSEERVQVMGLGDESPINILPPGSLYTLDLESVLYDDRSIPFYLRVVSADETTPLDWVEIEKEFRPKGISSNVWNQAWANLQDQLGSTWGQYATVLGEDAVRLAQRGQSTYNVTDLFGFEWDIAFGAGRSAIAGTLRDADTGAALPDVTITAYAAEGELAGFDPSNTNGVFVIDGLHPGLYAVNVEGRLLNQPLTVEVTETQDALDLMLEVTPGGTIAGYVETLNGAPIEQISVTLTGEVSRLSPETLTDKMGHFSFAGLPSDSYTVQTVTNSIHLTLAEREIRDDLLFMIEEQPAPAKQLNAPLLAAKKNSDTSRPSQGATVPSVSSNINIHVIGIDIEQTVTHVSYQSTNATLNLTTDSYPGDGTVHWTSVPSGITNSGTTITFNPSNLTPTQYVVTAKSSVLSECSDTCTVNVIKVDLDVDSNYDNDIDDADDLLEMNPGGVVCMDEIQAINLKLEPASLSNGVLTLNTFLEQGSDQVTIWKEATGNTEIGLPKKWTIGTDLVPSTLYVQGLKASSETRDIELILSYESEDMYFADDIKLTAIKIDLDVDADYDGTISIDDPDDSIEVSAGGRIEGDSRKEIILREVLPSTWDGKVILVKDSSNVKVFDAKTEGTEITFNGADNLFLNSELPKTLYVQGEAASSVPRDVMFILQPHLSDVLDPADCADRVTYTVLGMTDISVQCSHYPKQGLIHAGQTLEVVAGSITCKALSARGYSLESPQWNVSAKAFQKSGEGSEFQFMVSDPSVGPGQWLSDADPKLYTIECTELGNSKTALLKVYPSVKRLDTFKLPGPLTELSKRFEHIPVLGRYIKFKKIEGQFSFHKQWKEKEGNSTETIFTFGGSFTASAGVELKLPLLSTAFIGIPPDLLEAGFFLWLSGSVQGGGWVERSIYGLSAAGGIEGKISVKIGGGMETGRGFMAMSMTGVSGITGKFKPYVQTDPAEFGLEASIEWDGLNIEYAAEVFWGKWETKKTWQVVERGDKIIGGKYRLMPPPRGIQKK